MGYFQGTTQHTLAFPSTFLQPSEWAPLPKICENISRIFLNQHQLLFQIARTPKAYQVIPHRTYQIRDRPHVHVPDHQPVVGDAHQAKVEAVAVHIHHALVHRLGLLHVLTVVMILGAVHAHHQGDTIHEIADKDNHRTGNQAAQHHTNIHHHDLLPARTHRRDEEVVIRHRPFQDAVAHRTEDNVTRVRWIRVPHHLEEIEEEILGDVEEAKVVLDLGHLREGVDSSNCGLEILKIIREKNGIIKSADMPQAYNKCAG